MIDWGISTGRANISGIPRSNGEKTYGTVCILEYEAIFREVITDGR